VARSIPILVLVVSLAAAVGIGYSDVLRPALAAQGGPPGQNDAGSGQDAGDSPDAALVVGGARRTWSANLTPPGTDADWYRRDVASAFCAVASATTNSPGEIILASDPARETAVRAPVDPPTPTTHALAAPSGRMPFFGLEPMSLVQTYGSTSSGPPSPGRYTFEFSTRSHAELDPEGDGESPEAGATAATSAPLSAGCAAGRLQSSAGDIEDRYHVDITQAIEMTFSFAIASGAPADVTVLSPSGATRATLSTGETATVWLSEPGRWTIVVAYEGAAIVPARGLAIHALLPDAPATTVTEYLLGTTGGPDPEPCRPTCRR